MNKFQIQKDEEIKHAYQRNTGRVSQNRTSLITYWKQGMGMTLERGKLL
jgi:hypothetical protein